jgi:hypothetical protein
MKKNIILFLLMSVCSSCEEALNIAPMDSITEKTVFDSPELIEAYMASLYNSLPLDERDVNMMNSTDLSISNLDFSVVEGTSDGTWFSYWGYQQIRWVNEFLEKLPASTMSDAEKENLEGEALFLRAFFYFGMVKRYGGVPIVKEARNFVGVDVSELQVPRDREIDCWNFIAEDLDAAAGKLPPTSVQGRANRYAALALKSRAMLHAASIATYGSEQLDGVVGISASEKNRLWQAAYDAANAIIQSNAYSLYSKNSDRSVNFAEMFIEQDNPEAILRKFYKYPEKTHNYDRVNMPYVLRAPIGEGGCVSPTLELVEQFEYMDGSSGELKLVNADGSPKFYQNATDLFADKDPRCAGTVIIPYSIFKETVIEIRAGLYDEGVKIEGGLINSMYNTSTKIIDPDGTIPVHGNSGIVSSLQQSTQTGFYIRKYLDYTRPVSQNPSESHYIIFRYGEVLLNFAEAAIELDRREEAKSAINAIRSRAGIKLLENSEVTIDRVRHERLAELAFESHRWWDLIRWRTADVVLNNSQYTQLHPYWDIQEQAYRFEKRVLTERLPKTFAPRVYYGRIPDDMINKNPRIIQNPGY